MIVPLTEFVRVGFKRYATKQTAFNAAMSYNLKNAITGYYPNFSVDFEKVLLTRGNLQIPRNVEMVCDNYIIGLTWDTPMIGSPSEGEKAMILIYHPSKSEVVYETSGSDRGVGSHQISVPKEWKDETVEVFISFISEDGRDLSNSLYVGTIGVNSDI